MSVNRLDRNGDWTAGQGLANNLTESNEIAQNVATRIKSFQNDSFMDTAANIDWFNILGQKNNEQVVLQEVRRVALETFGVRRVDSVSVENLTDRVVTIRLAYQDIYGEDFLTEIGVGLI